MVWMANDVWSMLQLAKKSEARGGNGNFFAGGKGGGGKGKGSGGKGGGGGGQGWGSGGKGGGGSHKLATYTKQKSAGGGAAVQNKNGKTPAPPNKNQKVPMSNSGLNPKSALQQSVAKLLGRPVTKEDIVYTIEDSDDKFVTTLSVNCFDVPMEFKGSATRLEGKKAAEHNAAAKALQTKKLRPQSGKAAIKSGGAVAGQNKQKKASVSSDTGPNAKMLLNQGVMAIVGQVTKGDIVYESTKNEASSQYLATVNIQCLPGKKRFTGSPAEDKKSAEESAAETALQSLSSLIEKKTEERKKRKAEKQEEKDEEPKAKKQKKGAFLKLG